MTDFDCTAFGRWLDEGGADPARMARAEAHAAACGPCDAERAVVAVLLGPGTGARRRTTRPGVPVDFADRVMARVALAPQDTAAALPAFARVAGDVFPWWIHAAAQPASVLALALAGVATAFAPQLLGASRDAPQWSAAALAIITGALAPWLGRADAIVGTDPLAGAAFALALLPLVVLASLGLYRLGATLTTAHFAVPQAVRAGGRRA